jgi:hypothetical protein
MTGADVHMTLLRKAAEQLERKDVAPYLELRRLLGKRDDDSRKQFQRIFCRFYGLNAGGLTDDFRRHYFDRLFSLRIAPGAEPPYCELLEELHAFKRRRGDKVLPASFVSKLVAMHDESRPLYDRHVGNFFGVGAPGLGPLAFRINGFIANLARIRQQYVDWEDRNDFREIRRSLLSSIPELSACHVVRICDFLVWTAGRKRIDMPARRKKRRARRP